MTPGTVEILDRGMRCLAENMGVLETERFISALLRERFDYTEWHHGRFDDMGPEELHAAAMAYMEANPPEMRAVQGR